MDRAALDVALELGIPHGGWVPKGRLAEDGVISEKYRLKETPGESYSERTERNILDSDGTLIISCGKLTGGSALTKELALGHDRPFIHVDLRMIGAIEAARRILDWIYRNRIQALNIAGPRASLDSGIYEKTRHLLKTTYYLHNIEAHIQDRRLPQAELPMSVEAAVEMLMMKLPLRERSEIAHLGEGSLIRLVETLGNYIRDRFGLSSGNQNLWASCRALAGREDLEEEQALTLIIKKLWERLRVNHILKRIK